METSATIRSRSNPLLKRVGAIQAGREEGRVVLEGDRLIDDARRAGLAPEVVLVGEARADYGEALAREGVEVRLVADELLQRVSELKTSPGSLAISPLPRSVPPAEWRLSAEGLVLVACGVSDPGNLGALARSAEAAGAELLVVVQGGARPWNARALRGSMGSLLRLPVTEFARAEEARAALDGFAVRHVLAATRGGRPLDELDWSGRVSLWLTSETGEGAEADMGADFERVTIPTAGAVESLNVTVAASLLLFAAGRVRKEGGAS